MGHTHALSGAAAFLALTPAIDAVTPLGPVEIAAGTLVTAGAAMLPDLDHPSATIARTFGFLTHALARLTARLAGGHRQGTHSLAFVVLAGLGAQAATAMPLTRVWVVALMAGLATRALGLGVPGMAGASALVNAATTLVLVGSLTLLGPSYGWLGIAVALGCLMHLVGDCLTPEGCPLLWPARARLSVPVIRRTGNFVETGVLAPALTLACVWLLGGLVGAQDDLEALVRVLAGS